MLGPEIELGLACNKTALPDATDVQVVIPSVTVKV